MLCVPTFHPAFLLRSAEGGAAKFKDTVISDFAKAFGLRKRKPDWDESVIWERDPLTGRLVNLFPTVEEVANFCRSAWQTLITIDVETTGDEPLNSRLICIGIGSENGRAICVPILKRGGERYWTYGDEVRVRELLRFLFADQNTPKNFHNGAYDTVQLLINGLPTNAVCEPWAEDCYAEETEFLTARGWLKYDQISDSDQLATIATDGTMEFQRPIRRVKKPFSGKMYRFETPRSCAVVTDNHRMLCKPYWRRDKRELPWGFVRAGEMLVGSPDTYRVRVACEPRVRAETSTEAIDEAALLGLFVADGCFLWRKDRDPETPYGIMISQEVGGKAEVLLRGPLARYDFSQQIQTHDEDWRVEHCDEVRWTLYGKDLACRFLSYCGRYSRDRRVPDHILTGSDAIKRAFLRGLFYGDGSDVGTAFTYRTASWELAGGVQALAISLGQPATICRTGTVWGVTLSYEAPTTELLGARLKGRPDRRSPYENVTEIDYVGSIVCFTVPNETLVTRYGRKPAFYGNTMAAHHCADGEMPHNLGYVASRKLEVPYWKDDVKGDVRWLDLPDEVLRSYNLRDVLTTGRILPPLKADLAQYGLDALYKEEIESTSVMVGATLRGIAVDTDRRDSTEIDNRTHLTKKKKDGTTEQVPNPELGRPMGLGPKLRLDRDAALATLCRIAGSPGFKPRSQIHLRYLLFEALRFPVVRTTDKSGAPSTDKNAMVLLALHAQTDDQIAALDALIKFRKADKMLGTWVEGLPVLGDGRIHASWKMLPVTGRLASSPNMQNFNLRIKKIFRAAPGHKLVSFDLSQAELRVMALLAGDELLQRMYVDNLNVHTINACLLFQIKPPPGHGDMNPQTEAFLREMAPSLIHAQYDSFRMVTSDARWKSFRTLAKNFVFGDNYGAEASTLYEVIRAKRDPDTDELLFKDVDLGKIEALKILWERMHWWIPQWWKTISNSTIKQGFYRSPISGRIRFYRAGFNRNEMLNFPIQEFVAARMNKAMNMISRYMRQQMGYEGMLVLQVHDALTAEVPDRYVKITCEIFDWVNAQPFEVPGFGMVTLPADPATVGDYLDEV